MNALVMCGGRGTRLDTETEKPLSEVAGTPMVDRVLDGLAAAASVDDIFAAVSSNTPETATYLTDEPRVQVVETPGEGYVADLGTALDVAGPVAVTVAADLPLLAGQPVDRAIAAATGGGGESEAVDSVAVQVPARLKQQLGVSADEGATDDDWLPTGLNVVGTASERTRRTWDARLAVNVNYERDRAVAEALAGVMER
ncbi:MAG: NTP transferase domain-containing protein [Halolamina sp.]